MSAPLSAIDRARIRASSHCDEGTIRRYPVVSEASRARIERAAAELGIALPTLADVGASQEDKE